MQSSFCNVFGKNAVDQIGCVDPKHRRLHLKGPMNHVDDCQCLDQKLRLYYLFMGWSILYLSSFGFLYCIISRLTVVSCMAKENLEKIYSHNLKYENDHVIFK